MGPSGVNADKHQNFNVRKAMKSNIGTNKKYLRKVLTTASSASSTLKQESQRIYSYSLT